MRERRGKGTGELHVAFICPVLPDSLAEAPRLSPRLFHHAPPFVIRVAVARDTGAAILQWTRDMFFSRRDALVLVRSLCSCR